MAKNKQLPKGMNLEKVSISQEARTAICEWDVDSIDLLMQATQQFKISWKVTQVIYERKHGIF